MPYTRRACNFALANLVEQATTSRFRFFASPAEPDSSAVPVLALATESKIVSTATGDQLTDWDDAELIWGHGFVEAKEHDDAARCPVVVVIGADMGEQLRIALSSEGRSGAYGWEERRRIAEFCEQHRIPAGTVADLVDPSGDFIQHITHYRILSPVLRGWVEQGVCDLRTAERLAQVPTDLLKRLESTGDGLSFSNRRRYLVMAQEVLRRDGLDEATAVIADLARLDSPSERIEALRRVRYPTLVRMEEQLSEVNRVTLRGSGVRVTAPKNFEGGGYTVSFTFSSNRELERRLRSADRLREVSDDLLGLLFGNDR